MTMGQLIYLRNVVTLTLDETKCTGCGLCDIVCPHRVFERDGKKARISSSDACMECGACARNCRAEAIRVQAGVGCANAVINGYLKSSEPSCGCRVEPSDSQSNAGGCCC